jgi:hypothetical protein
VCQVLACLREDALLTMPPFPAAYRGHGAIGQFLRTVPVGGHPDQITLLRTRANLPPAAAAQVREPDGNRSNRIRDHGPDCLRPPQHRDQRLR